MITLEIKRDGEVIWLDRDRFKTIPLSRKSASRELVTDDRQAFEIYKGKRREQLLRERGYDPQMIYTGPERAEGVSNEGTE